MPRLRLGRGAGCSVCVVPSLDHLPKSWGDISQAKSWPLEVGRLALVVSRAGLVAGSCAWLSFSPRGERVARCRFCHVPNSPPAGTLTTNKDLRRIHQPNGTRRRACPLAPPTPPGGSHAQKIMQSPVRLLLKFFASRAMLYLWITLWREA